MWLCLGRKLQLRSLLPARLGLLLQVWQGSLATAPPALGTGRAVCASHVGWDPPGSVSRGNCLWLESLLASWPSLPDGLSWGGHHLGQPLSPVECGKLICVWIGETSMACGGGSSCPAHFHTVTSTQHLDTPKEAWSRPRAAASAVAMPLLGSARLLPLRWAEWEKEAGTQCPFRQGAVRIWPLLHAHVLDWGRLCSLPASISAWVGRHLPCS